MWFPGLVEGAGYSGGCVSQSIILEFNGVTIHWTGLLGWTVAWSDHWTHPKCHEMSLHVSAGQKLYCH